MKKLFIVGFALVVLISSLLVPNQVVSAKVSVSHPEIKGAVIGEEECESDTNKGGITHVRNCVYYVSYTSEDDSRLVGTNTITYSQNIFSDVKVYILKGNGNWVLQPEKVDDGWWAGTFTAYIDDTGMTVNIRGKGYGTLKGLFLEYIADGIEGTWTVNVRELPSYDGPGPKD